MKKIRGLQKNKKGRAGTFFIVVIILVIILLGVWGVKKWLNNRDSVLLETFPEKVQEDINEKVNKSHSWEKPTYKLPENFTEVCFLNKEKDNLVLKSDSQIILHDIENVDLAKITGENDEFCLDVVEGKVKMILRKKEDNPKVIIEKSE